MNSLFAPSQKHNQDDLEQALLYWDQWMQTASSLFEQQKWSHSALLIGRCFELAEWLLTESQIKPPLDSLSHADRYMLAGHQLAECLGNQGQQDKELHYLLTVHLTLLEQLKKRRGRFWRLHQNLEISQIMLNRYCQRHGQFKGFYDCLLETRLCINRDC